MNTSPHHLAVLAASSLTATLLLSNARAAVVLLTVTEDALINSLDNTNYNTGQFFDIVASETSSAGGYWGSWMKFDLTPLAGQSIVSASLELTAVFNHSNTAINHIVFSSSVDSWAEGTITGANQPTAANFTALNVLSVPNVNGVYAWDVLSAVTGIHGTDNATLSLFIRPETFPGSVSMGPHFNSKEAGIAPPVLRVTLIPEPSSAIFFLFFCRTLSITPKNMKHRLTRSPDAPTGYKHFDFISFSF